MAKYHIKKDGTPGICTAQHSCPLGGADEHFNSAEEAQNYADKKEKQKVKLQSKIEVPNGFDRVRRNVTGYHQDGAITAVSFEGGFITGVTYNENNKGLMLEMNGQHYQYYGVDKDTFNKFLFKNEDDPSIGKLYNSELKNKLDAVKHARKGRASKILDQARDNYKNEPLDKPSKKDISKATLKETLGILNAKKEHLNLNRQTIRDLEDDLKDDSYNTGEKFISYNPDTKKYTVEFGKDGTIEGYKVWKNVNKVKAEAFTLDEAKQIRDANIADQVNLIKSENFKLRGKLSLEDEYIARAKDEKKPFKSISGASYTTAKKAIESDDDYYYRFVGKTFAIPKKYSNSEELIKDIREGQVAIVHTDTRDFNREDIKVQIVSEIKKKYGISFDPSVKYSGSFDGTGNLEEVGFRDSVNFKYSVDFFDLPKVLNLQHQIEKERPDKKQNIK